MKAPSRSLRFIVLAAVVAIDLVAWGLRAGFAPEVSGVIDPSTMRAEQGRAWSAPLDAETPWWVRVPNDGAGISRLRLFERREGAMPQTRAAPTGAASGASGTELGPAHAPFDRVRERGAGAFNHWGELVFSASDGSDPRTNGAVYEWRSDTILHPRLGLILLALTFVTVLWALSGWFARAPGARVAVFALVAAALAIGWNVDAHRFHPAWINVDWDTASYLGWSPERTIGYPLLVEALSAVGGGLRWLTALQLNAMLAAFMALGLAIDRLLRSRVVGLAVFVLLATSPRLMAFPFNALTESFYVVGICALLALLAHLARERRDAHVDGSADSAARAEERGAAPSIAPRRPLPTCALAGLVLAATELVRPAAFGLAGMLLLPILWRRGARMRTLAALAIPYVLVMLAASLANERRFGFFATSAMGPVSLLGHVAWNIRAETVPEYAELAASIERRLAPVIARRPSPLSWPKQYFFVTSDEYNELLWANAMPETQAWVARKFAAGSAGESGGAPDPEARTRAEQRELLKVRGALARGALLSDLGAYARHVAAHVWGFWHSVARPMTVGPALKLRVTQSERSVANLWPKVRERHFSWLGPPPSVESGNTAFDRLTWMESWRVPLDSNPSLVWKLAVATTIIGVMVAPFTRRRWGAARLFALASVGFQGTALLVAAVTAVIARYVDAIEPLTVVACAAGCCCAAEAVARWRRVPDAAPAGDRS